MVDILELTDSEESMLTRVLQILLLGVVGFGLFKRSPSITLNAVGALGVSVLPALLRREISLRMGPGLVLWLTAAVLLHAIGIIGPYRNIWWWDYITHALSASIITGIGYAVVRALDQHSDEIHLPEPFFSVFLFLFVVATGVLWEVLEFATTQVSKVLGSKSVLVIYGVDDIITDIIFTTVGGILIVLWGRRYFHDLWHKLLANAWS